MNTSSEPSLAKDLIHIHRVISRSISIDTQKGIEYLRSGFSTSKEALGYTKFNNCLVSVMCSHHQAEDMIAHPVFRKAFPLAPFSQFESEHRHMESLLALIPELARDIAGDSPEYGLRVLVIILRKIAKIWEAHAQVEEQLFSEKNIPATLDAQLQQEICGTVIKLRHEHFRPPYWVVPFLLFKVEIEDRTSMMASFPSIAEELVLTGWKSEWILPQPYLQD